MLKINWTPSTAELRRFGATWMGATSILAALIFFRHHAHAAFLLWGISGTVGALPWTVPSAARLFYKTWMGVSMVIAWIVSKAALAIIFWGVLTPVAILFKMRGRDALRLKKSRSENASYWQDHEKITEGSYYKHLF